MIAISHVICSRDGMELSIEDCIRSGLTVDAREFGEALTGSSRSREEDLRELKY